MHCTVLLPVLRNLTRDWNDQQEMAARTGDGDSGTSPPLQSVAAATKFPWDLGFSSPFFSFFEFGID